MRGLLPDEVCLPVLVPVVVLEPGELDHRFPGISLQINHEHLEVAEIHTDSFLPKTFNKFLKQNIFFPATTLGRVSTTVANENINSGPINKDLTFGVLRKKNYVF